ncbi:MAG: 3-phenylpropionate/trans-cinnamate dioxygenase ferredoxin reductase component [Actinomycetota bacterium]|nr:3-phenylpropionate/trans-cinnamate dioxygenase ferredoxin reductase component [Actinomycetota bacterium]
MTSSHVVVVGGGLAAVRAAEEIRLLDPSRRITVIASETHPPYDRPPLSKQVLRGEMTDTTFPTDWSTLGVDLRRGVRAAALHPDKRTVLLDDGSTLEYDAVVLATGAQPRALPGLAGPGVHVLRTLDDARSLAADVRRTRRLTVLGAGFIGCEAAASARAMDADVTLVEVLPTPLARVLGTQVGAQVAALHQEEGVALRCGSPVLEARGEGAERELLLSDGSTVDAEVVLVGLGVTPDTAWLAESGVAVDDGVVCDATGRTSVAGVWAAGDVARWWHPLYDAHVRLEHWTSAAAQGAAVGQDVAGQGTPLDEVPYFWSDQYRSKLQMLGRPDADDDVTLLQVGPHADKLLAVYGREGRVTGVFGMSAARWVMRMRPLLAEQASYDEALALAKS